MYTKKPIILVVDDDPAVRDSLKFSLELEGLTVHTCDSGSALLDHPELEKAGCVVLDYKMPEMDGFEVLERLEERRISVPIILITGPVTTRIRERASRAGVAHILEKPLLDRALIDRIRDLTGDGGRGVLMDIEKARATILNFLKDRRLGVIATASNDGTPEAALINVAVTPDLELVFETTSATRKYVNLASNPRVCLVIGWDDDQTLQVDGLVDAPEGREYDRIKAFYLSTFARKASHEYWPGNDYYRVRIRWARLSNYNMPRKVEEFSFPIDEALYPLKRSWWSRLRLSRGVPQQRN